MPKFKENKLLDEIQTSKEYKAYQKLTQEVLYEQWEGILYSGIINQIYDKFEPIFRRRDATDSLKKSTDSDARAKINQAILSGRVASLEKLQRYTTDKVTGKMRKVGGMSGYGQSTKTYLYKVMNKGGQAELDRYLGVDKLKFRLSKEYYRQQIRERANTLFTGMDKITSKRFSKQLILGMDKGESKKKLVKRLLKDGENISKSRAKMIVQTETTAATEYMRHETAKLNGVRYSRWKTTNDERLCPVCRPLNDQVVPIDSNFETVRENVDGEVVQNFSLGYPPIHPFCRCYIEYDYENSLCSNELSKSFSKKTYEFYDENPEPSPACANPNAVWKGGEGVVGPDKNVAHYRDGFDKEGFKETWDDISWDDLDSSADTLDILVKEHGKSLYTNIAKLRESAVKAGGNINLILSNLTDNQLRMIQARAALSDEGFLQLAKIFGKKKIVPKKAVSDVRELFIEAREGRAKLQMNELLQIGEKYGLSEDETFAVSEYISGSGGGERIPTYRRLNWNLRFNEVLGDEKNREKLVEFMDDVSEKLSSALSKINDKKDGELSTVYRGMEFSSSKDYNNFLDDLTEEGIVEDLGFMSTANNIDSAASFVRETNEYNILLEIVDQKSGVSIKEFAGSLAHEDEILFDKGSKFKLKKMTDELIGGKKVKKIILEEVLEKKKRRLNTLFMQGLQNSDEVFRKETSKNNPK